MGVVYLTSTVCLIELPRLLLCPSHFRAYPAIRYLRRADAKRPNVIAGSATTYTYPHPSGTRQARRAGNIDI